MYVSGCLTRTALDETSDYSAHRIGIFESINSNLTNTLSTPPPEVKK